MVMSVKLIFWNDLLSPYVLEEFHEGSVEFHTVGEFLTWITERLTTPY